MALQQIGVILRRIMRGSMDKRTTALALAKQIKYDCEGDGDITLGKSTLLIVIDAFIEDWTLQQGKIRQTFEKVK